MADLETFREETRRWLEGNAPAGVRGPYRSESDQCWGGQKSRGDYSADQLHWLAVMGERGWTAPTWPREYGGGGLSKDEARILAEEMARLQVRAPLIGFGLTMIGPLLLNTASDAQKREHLPRICRGEVRWCQGYSEPGAGSDLAGLQARAVLDGEQYVVDGQKVWTSHGDKADWMFLLVRTAVDVPKHQGISFLLMDMTSPGVAVRPIRLISGASPFCETFLTGVRVPARNVVGQVNGGWGIAKMLLQFERNMIADAFKEREDRQKLLKTARMYLATENGRICDPVVRDRLTQIELDQFALDLTLARTRDRLKAGQPPGPETSFFKLYGTELNQRRRELMVEIAGHQGLGWEGPGFNADELRLTRDWLRSRGNTIEGGTSEVQLNIIAKNVLGLPD
ncbi:MAG: acyl-CoA dehydrogenase family protein [Candidatus Binatia bacterium]